MILLGLDPSTTCTGYAVFDAGDDAGVTLLECGLMRPEKRLAPYYDRVASMGSDLRETLTEYGVDAVAMESPGGKTHGRIQGGKAANLDVWGFAIGAMWAICRDHSAEMPVALYPPNEHTRGVSKSRRASANAVKYPLYDADQDPGYDASDAICVGEWHLTQTGLI